MIPPPAEGHIVNALYHDLVERGHRIVCPNVHCFRWESDVLSITRAGFAHEFEVKRTASDFRADFVKEEKHIILRTGKRTARYWSKPNELVDAGRPNCFWYVCFDRCIDRSSVPEYAGLISAKWGMGKMLFEELKPAPKLHGQKLPGVDLVRILTSAYYRYWKLRLEKVLS